MKVTMIAVISQDGFLTSGNNPNPSSWTSPEDLEHYRNSLRAWPLLIMGRTTYELAKDTLPEEAEKAILSNQPLTKLVNKVQIMTGSPEDIVKSLAESHDKALLLGGGRVFTDFLEAGCVDEVLLTVEPLELRDGLRLFEDWQNELKELGFNQQTGKPLNQTGTILYTFVK